MNIEDVVKKSIAKYRLSPTGTSAKIIRAALIEQESEFKLQRDELLNVLEALTTYAAMRSDWLANGHNEPEDHPITVARRIMYKTKGAQS